MRNLISLIALVIIFSDSALAAYIRNVPIFLKQPDGSVLNCFISGDEFSRRTHDGKDYTIMLHPQSGFYVYALQNNDGLIASDCIAGKCDPAEMGILPGAQIPSSSMEENRNTHLKSLLWPLVNPTRGNVNNIVISIRFRDQVATTLTSDNYEKAFNDEENLSLKSYFSEVSGQQLNLSSHFFPRSDEGIILEYNDIYPRSYYSPYHETENPGGYVSSGWTIRQQVLLENAVKWAAGDIIESGIDFDLNEDGFIDNIMFVFQGTVDAWGDILWPSTGFMPESKITIGDKKTGTFNKLLTEMMEPAVSCHEFFHSLGAPDLYRYYNRDVDPAGAWDIMGHSTGQQMSVYMKWRYGKWMDKLTEASQSGTYSLKPSSKEPFHALKIPSPSGFSEYFVAEYRKKEGLADSNLPQEYEEGLIIYRVDTRINWGNAWGPPDELYVFRYCGDSVLNGRVHQAALSPGSGRTFLNPETNPGLFLSNGTPAAIEISQVSYTGDSVTFRLSFLNPLPAPENFKSKTESQEIHFTWNKPSGKQVNNGYNLYRKGSSQPLNTALITDTHFRTMLPGNDLYYSFELRAVYPQGESSPVSCFVMNTDDPALLDSIALVILYRECNGDNWTNKTNWLEGPVSSWQGVVRSGGRVTELSLTGSISVKTGVSGRLPGEIGNLTGLKTLRLNNNQLTGSIPEEIGKLQLLENLHLFDTQLSGEIPDEIGSLYKLQSIDLGFSNFSGQLPDETGNLAELEQLSLTRNKINGELPEGLWRLKNLKSLDLEGNQMTGPVPSGIGGLTALKILNLGQNKLSGTLPEELTRLVSLEAINLAGNDLSGEVLPLLTTLNRLKTIRMENNRFTGSFPGTLANLRNLEELVLSNNQFSGELPEELGWLRYLSGNLWLDNNRFSGNVPYGLAGFSLIRNIKLENNRLEHLPDLTGLTNLERLSLDGNRFTFEDLEPNAGIVFNPGNYGISYSNQQKIGAPEKKYAPPGKSLELSVYCGGNHNEYQWFKNGIPISGKAKEPLFLIPEVANGDNGSYFCTISNPKVPGLVIESHPLAITGENLLIANAGHDRAADEGTIVNLDGKASFNPYPGITLYKWTAPAGIVLNEASTASPGFTAPQVEYDKPLTFSLIISNGTLSSDPDEVVITIRNTGNLSSTDKKPIALPGINALRNAGSRVTLDGSASFDPEGEPVTFSWKAPAGIELDNDKLASPSFTAPEVSAPLELIFTLTVSDGKQYSDPAAVKITVQPVFRITEYISICEGQAYNGWTETGIYERLLKSGMGFDSLVTTNLTTLKVYFSEQNVQICKGDEYLGWSVPGRYQVTLRSAEGCDSVMVTHLDFHPQTAPELLVNGDTLSSLNPFNAYQWYLDGIPLNGAIKSRYIIQKSGVYWLVARDNNGCLNTSASLDLIYSNTEWVRSQEFRYQIYPNPADKQFLIQTEAFTNGEIRLVLSEVTGRMLEVRKIKPSVLHKEWFDVSHLKRGVYMLTISSEKINETVKILVN